MTRAQKSAYRLELESRSPAELEDTFRVNFALTVTQSDPDAHGRLSLTIAEMTRRLTNELPAIYDALQSADTCSRLIGHCPECSGKLHAARLALTPLFVSRLISTHTNGDTRRMGESSTAAKRKQPVSAKNAAAPKAASKPATKSSAGKSGGKAATTKSRKKP